MRIVTQKWLSRIASDGFSMVNAWNMKSFVLFYCLQNSPRLARFKMSRKHTLPVHNVHCLIVSFSRSTLRTKKATLSATRGLIYTLTIRHFLKPYWPNTLCIYIACSTDPTRALEKILQLSHFRNNVMVEEKNVTLDETTLKATQLVVRP